MLRIADADGVLQTAGPLDLHSFDDNYGCPDLGDGFGFVIGIVIVFDGSYDGSFDFGDLFDGSFSGDFSGHLGN